MIRRSIIDKHSVVSIRRQCSLLDINRSGLYQGESDENLKVMELLDKYKYPQLS